MAIMHNLNDLGPNDVVRAAHLNEYLRTDVFKDGDRLTASIFNTILGSDVTKDGMNGRTWATAIDNYWKSIHPDASFHI
jgi:hypothetical protein